MDENASPHYLGHRQRLRARFLKDGLRGLADYEAVELLLTLAIPRRDVKPLAKALIGRFGNLRGLLDAREEELRAVPGLGEGTHLVLRLVRESAELYLRQSLEGREHLGEPERMAQLWQARLGAARHEVFEVAYLDAGGRLLREGIETLEEGGIDWAAISPRRVIEGALRRGAALLIVAHNHPGGTPHPSEHDKDVTAMLIRAAAAVEVRLLDHLIIAGSEVFSFRKAGLL
jgi:DNA repair protein RadC